MIYQPLDNSLDQIRLLSFASPSSESEPIHCRLEVVSLQDLRAPCRTSLPDTAFSQQRTSSNWPRILPLDAAHDNARQDRPTQPNCFSWGDYTALSYTWGDPLMTREVIINRSRVQITTNLEVGLRTIRARFARIAGFRLWVDAICIDQKNGQERGMQVEKMKEIYVKAQTVIAWLGEEADRSDNALALLRTLAGSYGDERKALELESRLFAEPEYLGRGSWLALHEFMKRPYWSRLWIIQDIVLGSSRLQILCGRKCMDWRCFCYGVGTVNTYLWRVKNMLLDHDRAALGIDNNTAWESMNLHHVWKDLWVLSQVQERGGESLDLFKLLQMSSFSNATDPRDKVYGLLGLMDTRMVSQIAPNYDSPVANVFIAVAKSNISISGNLEILRDCNPWGKANAPSWCPDWTWNNRLRDARDVAPFHAAGDLRSSASFGNGHVLTCRGFIIDTIKGLGAHQVGKYAWKEESIVQPAPCKSAYGAFEATSVALYRVLVADRRAEGHESETADSRHRAILDLPSNGELAFAEYNRRGWTKFATDGQYYDRWMNWRRANRTFCLGDRPLNDYFTEAISPGIADAGHWESYQAWVRTIGGRKLVVTTKGFLGWAPDFCDGGDEQQSLKGDVICIIFGCSTPIVLRPHGELHQVVGEGYIQGFMEGESLKHLGNGEYEVRDFKLC